MDRADQMWSFGKRVIARALVVVSATLIGSLGLATVTVAAPVAPGLNYIQQITQALPGTADRGWDEADVLTPCPLPVPTDWLTGVPPDRQPQVDGCTLGTGPSANVTLGAGVLAKGVGGLSPNKSFRFTGAGSWIGHSGPTQWVTPSRFKPGVDPTAAVFPDDYTFSGFQPDSFEAWVQTAATTSASIYTTGDSELVGLDEAGRPFIRLSTYNGPVQATSSKSVSDGAWHHIGAVATAPSGGVAGSISVYVDG